MIRRLIAALLLFWLIGFAVFALLLPQPLGPYRTDGIVVFTGGSGRIDHALALLDAGQADRLLISGVDSSVSMEQVADAFKIYREKFNCCVALGREAVDTRSNGDEVARWVARRNYHSIRLVTNDWHMRRARYEVERALAANIIVVSDAVPSQPSLRTLWREYNKYVLRRIGALLGI